MVFESRKGRDIRQELENEGDFLHEAINGSFPTKLHHGLNQMIRLV